MLFRSKNIQLQFDTFYNNKILMTLLTSLKPVQTGTIPANGLNLYYETFGNRGHPPVLLIMGLSSPCWQWFPYFFEPIVNKSYYVIRFDNRDIGRSTWINHDEWQKSPYTLEDMAEDARELLKALKIDKVHLIGASMGGAIAQRLAISYPEYVLSLTSLISFANSSVVGARGISASNDGEIPSLNEYLAFWSYLSGSAFPFDSELYSQLYRESIEKGKGYNPYCMTHQLTAIGRSLSRMSELGKITIPTLVAHGTEDPLIPVSHASEYAALFPNGKLLPMEGVGHEVPEGICHLLHPEIFNLLTQVTH